MCNFKIDKITYSITTYDDTKNKPSLYPLEDLFVLIKFSSIALVDALVETSWLDKPPHHVKVGFIEGNEVCRRIEIFCSHNDYHIKGSSIPLKIEKSYYNVSWYESFRQTHC